MFAECWPNKKNKDTISSFFLCRCGSSVLVVIVSKGGPRSITENKSPDRWVLSEKRCGKVMFVANFVFFKHAILKVIQQNRFKKQTPIEFGKPFPKFPTYSRLINRKKPPLMGTVPMMTVHGRLDAGIGIDPRCLK